MSSGDDRQGFVNPYSTGGGGTVLEHRYGAMLLSRLLTGDPIPGLGDHVTPTLIRFQASAVSPVDDLLVVGSTVGGEERWLSIGVRRSPKLVVSEEASVKLITAYVRTVVEHWPELDAGRWKLQLAVRPSCVPALELKALAEAARAAGGAAEFRKDMSLDRYLRKEVRERLAEFDKIIDRIAKSPSVAASGVDPSELAWRVLSKLSLAELHLEGVDDSDRTTSVALLKAVTPDGRNGTGSDLFSRLAELVGDYAPHGSRVRISTVYADLHGVTCLKPPPEDVVLDLSGGTTDPAVRADSLMRGPINAIAGLSSHVARAEAAIDGDPAVAAHEFETVARVLDSKGFVGHATLLRQQCARDLRAAGHVNAAVGVLATLLEGLISQAAEHEARVVSGELRRLRESGGLAPAVERLAHDTLVLYASVNHPFDDLAPLLEVFDSGRSKPIYALVLSETAVATDQTGLVLERADALVQLAHSADEELVRVRIELAVAEARRDWSDLLARAARQHFEPKLAALVRARYARHLTLGAQPDEAAAMWWDAINSGALAEVGDDAAEWLYSVRFNSYHYGPVTAESETHPLAQAMRLSGGNIAKRRGDDYNSALGELRDEKLPAACQSARRALRNSVTYGHLGSELMAAELLADVFAAAGEAERAARLYARAGRSEKLTNLLGEVGDRYIDLSPSFEARTPWERYSAYKAIATQADLVPDVDVRPLVQRAVEDFKAGLATRIRQAPFPFAPALENVALDAAASLTHRAGLDQVRELLGLLEPLVQREPNRYRHSDEGHVRSLAAVLDRNDELGPVAAEQLLDLLALNGSVSQQVMKIAGDSIAGRVDLFSERLPSLIESSFSAAWLLAGLGMIPPDGSQAVDRAYKTLISPYQEPPGVLSMGLPLGLNAMLVRHLPEAKCEAAARMQLTRAMDNGQPALNRAAAIDALRVLSTSVSAEMRVELFNAGICFARGSEDGSLLDDLTGSPHPLSDIRVNFGASSLSVPGLQLAAVASEDAVTAGLVESLAAQLLAAGSRETGNGVAQALVWLGAHTDGLSPEALAIHENPSIRSVAAVRWVRSAQRDPQTGLRLADDRDYHVRLSLAVAVGQAQHHNDDTLGAVHDRLASDLRFSVRRAVGK